jgi:hypothetical protein
LAVRYDFDAARGHECFGEIPCATAAFEAPSAYSKKL